MRKESKKQNAIFIGAAAFGLTAMLLCAVYACFGLFPFGDKTLAWGDMKQQVIPLMLEFKDILAGRSGFLLNLQNAGGMSFWGVFFFFLASPFTFLAVFIEKADIYFLVNILVLLKLSLSAVTAFVFFREEQPRLEKGEYLFLGVSYALCGYGLLYYQNLVWLDVLCLFPVLMTGFRRVLDGRKAILFTVSLVLMIVFNYYLSYMVLLALVLMSALFIKNCVPKERRGETAGKIGLSAVISLLLTALVWLPSLLQCLRSARTARGLMETVQSGGFFTEWTTTLPVLLCTGTAAALPALFFSFPSSSKRKTLLELFVLTSLPLIAEPINKLWHTGSYQAFPARYGYIPLFLALWYTADILGERADFRSVKPERKRLQWVFLLAPCFLAALCWVLLLFYLEGMSSYTSSLWFDGESFFFLLLIAAFSGFIVWLGFFLFRRGKLGRRVLSWALLAVCLTEGGYHAAVLIGPAANLPKTERAVLQTENTLSDTGLYRVKLDRKFCDVNLLGAAGYPTLDHYTSLTDESFLHAVKKLGYSSYWMETSSCCGTALTDILLSNKYTLTDSMEWKATGSGDLGYILPAGALPETMPDGNRFDQQNDIFLRILGSAGQSPENAFTSYPPSRKEGVTAERIGKLQTLRKSADKSFLRYEISVSEEEILYFDAFSENTNRLREKINGSFRVTVNGHIVSESYPAQNCNGILKLGRFQNETVTVEIELLKDVEGLKSFGVSGLNLQKLEAFKKVLENAKLREEKNHILGTAKANGEGQSLFLGVAYAPGMKAQVNGRAVPFRKVLDCFLKIPLDPGQNEIELSYLPQGVIPGAVLSCCGALLLLAVLVFRKRRGKVLFFWNRLCGFLLPAACWAVLLGVYLLPVLIWLLGLF